MALQNYERNRFFRNPKQKQPEHRINDFIQHRTVRIVGEGIENKVCTIEEAKAIASQMELDLVEISSEANPPVCKVIDYQKFLYEKKKKEKEIRKSNNVKTKEIQLGPHTQDEDLKFKARHAENFLKQGHKVRVSLMFRAREIVFKEQGELVMAKFITSLEEVGKPEFFPKLEGKKLFVVIAPK